MEVHNPLLIRGQERKKNRRNKGKINNKMLNVNPIIYVITLKCNWTIYTELKSRRRLKN